MASRKQSRKRRKAKGKRPVEAPVSPPVAARSAKKDAPKPLPGDGRPPPIWGNIPVTQAAVLGGLFLLVFGMIKQNPMLVFPGLALGSVGGLELSLREHFTGFRSHTTLLAGVVFVLVVAVTFLLLKWILWVCLAVALVVAIPAFWAFRRSFEHASGGLSYKLK